MRMVLQVSDRIETLVRDYMAREGFEDADAAIESLLDRSGLMGAAAPDIDRITLTAEEYGRVEAILSKPPLQSDAFERAKQRHRELIDRSEP